jgi:hypothetical protein
MVGTRDSAMCVEADSIQPDVGEAVQDGQRCGLACHPQGRRLGVERSHIGRRAPPGIHSRSDIACGTRRLTRGL